MALKDGIFALIIIILWFVSVFLIATPASVESQMLGGSGLSDPDIRLLGIGVFIISLFVVIAWIGTMKDETEKKKEQRPPTAPPPPPPSPAPQTSSSPATSTS